MPLRPRRAPLFALACAWLVLSCEQAVRVSERHAEEHVRELAKVVDDDVEQVRRGLPRGAKALAGSWDSQSERDLPALRHTLEHLRSKDPDLQVAKSTFFALSDVRGTVMCSDQEPDRLAGVGLVGAFPALRTVLAGEPTETRGALREAAGAQNGSDEQWLAGAPVRDGTGVLRGMYVTGWSLRRFAYHLEETLKHDLVTAALRSGQARVKQPLLYVFVFAGAKTYGAPLTPLVNSEALEKLDLTAKTASGAIFHAPIEITGRDYGIAAGRTPKLGSDVGVAVLRSET